MAVDQGFVEHCGDLLASLGHVRARRMFGGCGFHVGDRFVALIVAERLYLKADALTRHRFEAAGCEPFVYATRARRVATAFFAAPHDAMESPGEMEPWARLALEAATRAKGAKRVAGRRGARRPGDEVAAKAKPLPAKPRATPPGRPRG